MSQDRRLDAHRLHHAESLQRMLARAPAQEAEGQRPLADLNLGAPQEPARAFLDAAATLCELLSFTGARYAEESYLGSARDGESIHKLARALGAPPRGGLSARAHLAFTVDQEVEIPAGASARGQAPAPHPAAIFETSAPLAARPELNALLPLQERRPELALVEVSTGTWRLCQLELTSPLALDEADAAEITENHQQRVQPLRAELITALSRHEGALRYAPLRAVRVRRPQKGPPEPGAWLLFVSAGDSPRQLAARVTRVRELEDKQVELEFRSEGTALGTRQLRELPSATPELAEGPSADAIRERLLSGTWSDADLRAVLQAEGWSFEEARQAMAAPPAPRDEDGAVLLFTESLGFFGHQAPGGPRGGSTSATWDATDKDTIELDEFGTPWSQDRLELRLERALRDLPTPSWMLIDGQQRSGGVQRVAQAALRITDARPCSMAAFDLTGRAHAITLDSPPPPGFLRRGASAWIKPEALTPAPTPLGEDLVQAAGGAQDEVEVRSVALSALIPGLEPGRTLIVEGPLADAPEQRRAEVAELRSASHSAGFTVLHLTQPLSRRYRLAGTQVLANVAEATHGERVEEVLGSGDASQAGQQLRLPRGPLAYTPSAEGDGRRSTLELRVQGQLWTEREDLSEAGPEDRVFTVLHQGDETWLRFGDGERGARLPSGARNVLARYRVGGGLGGLLPAEAIKSPVNLPPGARRVRNPLPSADAQDAEAAEDLRARLRASLDATANVVSLAEHAAFARGFAGVQLARAELVRIDRVDTLALSVLAVDAAGFDPELGLGARLRAALDEARVPSCPLQLLAAEPLDFNLRARLTLTADADPLPTLEAAAQALRARSRRFGLAETVRRTDLASTLLSVPGVRAVDVDALHLRGDAAPSLQHALVAKPARLEDQTLLGAQRLQLHPLGLSLELATDV
ncbi:MAG: hypothetical protein H6741_19750 [Alphaproteobacteria bacterium]|nr:hypothetical protein [Alphaproteobacteria bacterium]MCB9794940.1 hypothetical protein [Alphaproteobacteria bacterium]